MAPPFSLLRRFLSPRSRARLQRRRQQRRLLLEPLEQRTVLAAPTSLAAIAGTVFTDATDNGLTMDDARVPAATVRLYRDGGNLTFDNGGDDTLIGTQTSSAIPATLGNYRFDSLPAGRYFVQQQAVAGLLQRPAQTVQTVDISAAEAAGTAGTVIDSFNTTAQTVSASPVLVSAFSAVAATEAVGGERDAVVNWTSGAGTADLSADQFDSNTLTFTTGTGVTGNALVAWDGADGNATSLNAAGLNATDLTQNGQNLGLRLVLGADQAGASATLRVYSSAANSSSITLPIPATAGGTASVTEYVPFSAFTVASGAGATFASVGAVTLTITGAPSVDAVFDDLGAWGPTVRTTNFANLSPLSIGDLVWRDTNNNGIFDGGESGITGVSLTLFQDSNGSGDYTPGTDTQVATATTNVSGNYAFSSLFPGEYLVIVDAANFSGGGPLVGLTTSTGNNPAPDPDNDANNDDNGTANGALVAARALTLAAGAEPVNDGDSNPHSNLTVDFGFAQITNLTISKTDNQTTAVPGANLTYVIQVTNEGPSAVTGAAVADSFPASITAVNYTASQTGGATGFTAAGTGNINDIVNMPVSSAVTYTAVATVSPAATGSISNTATVTAPAGVTETTTSDNSAPDTDTLTPQANLKITKTDNVTTAVPGGTLTYVIVVTNDGPSNVTGATIADVFPTALTGVTYTATATGGATGFTAAGFGTISNTVNMPAGSTITYTVQATVSPSATGSLTNTATVTAPAGVQETNTGDNTATATDTLTPQANLTITKTDNVTTAVPGGTLTYTIVVTNTGPSNVTGATVADTFPTTLSNVSYTATATGGATGFAAGTGNINHTVTMPVGSTITYTVQATVSAAATGTLTNTATVTAPAGVTETNTADNTASDTDTLTPQANLKITKTDNQTTATPGGTLTYVIVVTNDGPSNVTGATVTDTFPATLSGITFTATATGGATGFSASGTGNLSQTVTMPAGSTITYTVQAKVSSAATGTLANTATVAAPAGVTETNTTDNSATDTDTLVPSVDLVITKTCSPADAVTAGQQLTYTLNVTNNGVSDATGVRVTDTLPSQLAFNSGTVTGDSSLKTVTNNNGTITADLGNLAAGKQAAVTLVTTVNANTQNTTITNPATVQGNETETNTTNNSSQKAVVVTPAVSSIAGVVYVDMNDNGVQDAGEQPIAGVKITLTGTDAAGTAVNTQATTDANGAYQFNDLRAGNYTLTETQPVNFRDGKDTPGTAQGTTPNTAGSDAITNISLGSGVAATGYRFGERRGYFSKRRFMG
jgi:uncharacterized repeat protein (TIGR01451 family)